MFEPVLCLLPGPQEFTREVAAATSSCPTATAIHGSPWRGGCILAAAAAAAAAACGCVERSKHGVAVAEAAEVAEEGVHTTAVREKGLLVTSTTTTTTS
jgi:hypothetical protein